MRTTRRSPGLLLLIGLSACAAGGPIALDPAPVTDPNDAFIVYGRSQQWGIRALTVRDDSLFGVVRQVSTTAPAETLAIPLAAVDSVKPTPADFNSFMIASLPATLVLLLVLVVPHPGAGD